MARPPFDPGEGWVVPEDVRHERVVWLAARDELARVHRRWWHPLTRVLRANTLLYRTAVIDHRNPENDDLSAALQQASVIVDGLAGHFSVEERATVRRTGVLPDWFWPVYLGAFEDARREVGASSLRR
jgi:hypothetical protein